MGYIITQSDRDIVQQNVKEVFVKVELLNKNYKVVDVLEGYLISDSFTIDANSSIRRTYNMDLVITDSSLLIDSDKKIWMDKYIRPYVGYKNLRTKEIQWYLKGTFVMLDSSYSYDQTTNELSLSCSDLMSELNGERNGIIIDSTTIKEGEYAREVITDILKEANITKYIIKDMDGIEIPHELEFDVNQTYFDMLNTIVELFSYFEMFFDLDGTFIIQKIPHQDADMIVIDSGFLAPLVISESINTSFKDVYNKVKVWGQSLETDFSTSVCTYYSNVYNATMGTVTSLDNFTKYAIYISDTNQADAKLNINNLGALYITDDKGKNLPANTVEIGYNVFKYRKADNNFYWLGHNEVYAEASETNTESIFHKDKIGEIIKVCSGDEYSKIYSNSLAQDRADYELWHACRLQESLELNLIDIPWLDVNWLIEYTSYVTKETNRYVIKQISGSSSSATIQISMVKFYDQDPYS